MELISAANFIAIIFVGAIGGLQLPPILWQCTIRTILKCSSPIILCKSLMTLFSVFNQNASTKMGKSKFLFSGQVIIIHNYNVKLRATIGWFYYFSRCFQFLFLYFLLARFRVCRSTASTILQRSLVHSYTAEKLTYCMLEFVNVLHMTNASSAHCWASSHDGELDDGTFSKV